MRNGANIPCIGTAPRAPLNCVQLCFQEDGHILPFVLPLWPVQILSMLDPLSAGLKAVALAAKAVILILMEV